MLPIAITPDGLAYGPKFIKRDSELLHDLVKLVNVDVVFPVKTLIQLAQSIEKGSIFQ